MIKRANSREYYSYKIKHSAVCYKVAVCIQSGEIVWFSGPHKPGLFNGVTIFRQRLRQMLLPNEKVEADDGYQGEYPAKALCPNGFGVSLYGNRRQATLAQARHENMNERFKNWAIMTNYRHKVELHGTAFGAVAVLTQLSIFGGDRLADVEYY